MATEVYAVAPGDLVADVASTMGERKYGCAIVVDRGHVVGIFTATDALALLARATS
jgi:CBS domain-containing protein